MDTYEYWAHEKSGEVWAVHIQDGEVVGACGPLNHRDRPADMRDFEYSQEEAAWIEDCREDFRLWEAV